MAERMSGHVQQFSHQRRSGLVQPDDGDPVIWVFLSDFRSITDGSRVMPGDAVEFEVEHTPQGPMAVDVVILKNDMYCLELPISTTSCCLHFQLSAGLVELLGVLRRYRS